MHETILSNVVVSYRDHGTKIQYQKTRIGTILHAGKVSGVLLRVGVPLKNQ